MTDSLPLQPSPPMALALPIEVKSTLALKKESIADVPDVPIEVQPILTLALTDGTVTGFDEGGDASQSQATFADMLEVAIEDAFGSGASASAVAKSATRLVDRMAAANHAQGLKLQPNRRTVLPRI